MPILGLIPLARLIPVIVMVGITWQVQDWRYSSRLDNQARQHAESMRELSDASRAQFNDEQRKRQALEQRLAANDQTHHRVLTDAQRNQSRLRDRLATADVRLSVFIQPDSDGLSANRFDTSTPGRVVHGTLRAELDRAAAQRIIDIVADGDQGLIALAACQSYVRDVVAEP